MSAFASRHPSLGMPSPMVMTARHLAKRAPSLHVFGEALAQAVQTFRDLFVGMRRHRLGSGIDLDPGNNAHLFQCLGEWNSRSRLLADGFVHQDGAVEAIAQAGGGDDHVAIGAPGLLVLGNARGGKSLVGCGRAFIHSQQALVAGTPWLLPFRSTDEHPS